MASKSPRPTGTGPEPQPVIHSVAEYAIVVIGFALLFLGWYGISGKLHVAEQLPILASASLPGAAMVIGGAVLVASDRNRRSNDRAANMIDSLYQLLTEAVDDERGAVAGSGGSVGSPGGTDPSEATDAAGAGARRGALLAVPDGTRFHRSGCALVDETHGAEPVDAGAIAARSLHPCPICDPPSPGG